MINNWQTTINKFFAQHVKPAAHIDAHLNEQTLYIAYHEWRSCYHINAKYIDQSAFMHYVNEHEFNELRVVRYNKYGRSYLNIELINMEEIYVSNVIAEHIEIGELK